LIAYGVGELSGLLNGLSLGNSIINLILQFRFFVFGLVFLYGVIFWSNVFTRSDALKTFADFIRVGIWFIWVVLVFTLFTTKYEGSVMFVPTTIRLEMLNDGLKVITPGGEEKFVDVSSPYQKIDFTLPAVFGALDLMDSPVYLLNYYLTASADPIKWGGYAGNELSPTKLWSKCFSVSLASAPNISEIHRTICYFLPKNEHGFLGITIATTWSKELSDICSVGLGKSEPSETVINNYKKCVLETIGAVTDNLIEQQTELEKLKEEGKISNEEYQKTLKEIDETTTKLTEIKQNLVDRYEIVWKDVLTSILQDNPKAFESLRMIKDNSSAPFGAVRDVVEFFSEFVSQVFVGQTTMLYYIEAAIKFMLALEVGIAFPLLILLSTLPDDRGIFPFRVSNLLLACGSYLLLRFMRTLIFLFYLIGHNYFFSRGF